jgi:hypothetical protein
MLSAALLPAEAFRWVDDEGNIDYWCSAGWTMCKRAGYLSLGDPGIRNQLAKTILSFSRPRL